MNFDGLSEGLSRFATRAPRATTIARFGLGSMVFAAGVHKLFDPLAWAVYVDSLRQSHRTA